MPGKPILMLYVGEDFLFPMVFSAEGTAYSLREERVRYFWLYFNVATGSADYSHQYKAEVANQVPGYYGNFLENCASGQTVNIQGRSYAYAYLLEHTGMAEDLKKLFSGCIADYTPEIPTAYVFAESIPARQRKALLEAMKQWGFSAVSYSALFSEIVMHYIQRDDPEMKPVLSDRALILNSVNDDLVLTQAIFDGEKWISDGICQIEKEFGESPIKDALVRYVIHSIDRSNGYLYSDALKNEEFVFQRHNADKWLNQTQTGGDLYVSDFQYKGYGGPFTCTVPEKVLQQEIRDSLRKTVSGVTAYIRDRIGDHLRIVVMVGSAFEDRDVVDKIVDGLSFPKYRVLTGELLADIFADFSLEYSQEEDLRLFDSILKKQEMRGQAVSDWAGSAADIREHLIAIRAALEVLRKQDALEQENFEAVRRRWKEAMVKSDFEAAEQALDKVELPNAQMRDARQSANVWTNKVRERQDTYRKMDILPGAHAATQEIIVCKDAINELIVQSNNRVTELSQLRKKTAEYKQNYPRFIELKNQFDQPATSHQERKEIREQMAALTMESVPDAVLRHVKVSLEASISRERASLFRTKKMLHVHFEVLNGESLPCPAVLNILDTVPLRAMPDSHACIRIDIPQGERAFSQDFDVSAEPRIQEGKALYITLLTEEHQIDTDAILDESGSDKPIFRISQV